MIGLVLGSAKSLKTLQLVRITVPLIRSTHETSFEPEREEGSIFRLSSNDIQLRKTLEQLQTLNTTQHPFVAWPLDHSLIQIVCFKVVVAKLFKSLFTQQRALGIHLIDLKSHVFLSPMDPTEVQEAVTQDIHQALKTVGWHKLTSPADPGSVFLGVDPLEHATGKPHTCASLQVHVEIRGTHSIVLLLVPSTVRFRHSTASAFDEHSDLRTAARQLIGTLCKVLPTETPAIIDNVRLASSDQEARKIESEWSNAGVTLPTLAAEKVVDVRFDEDPDAPTTPFPACAVLSTLGFDPVDTKLTSGGVLATLSRLRRDLSAASFKLWDGHGELTLQEARHWDMHQNPAEMVGFKSAAQMSAAATTNSTTTTSTTTTVLGECIDFEALLQEGEEAAAEMEGSAPKRAKKEHARAGPELLAYLSRLQQEEEREEAAAVKSAAAPPALPPAMAMAAQAAQAARKAAQQAVKAPLAVLGGKKVPLFGAKKASAAAAQQPHQLPAAKKTVKKTTALAGGALQGEKPPKASPVEIDVAALDVPGLAVSNKLGSLTIPKLKAYCRSVKLAVGGKKGDLETRIKSHLGIATPDVGAQPVATEQ